MNNLKVIMKFILAILIAFFFNACSFKKDFDFKQIKSFSINKDILISTKEDKNIHPFVINLGLNNYISKHIGIHIGTTYSPKVFNKNRLDLENLSFSDGMLLDELIFSVFKEQISKNNILKNKYVPFGADYKLALSVNNYYLKSEFFSSKSMVKIEINIKMLDKNSLVIYDDTQQNDSLSRYYKYSEYEILNSEEILKQTLEDAISNCVAKILYKMENNDK